VNDAQARLDELRKQLLGIIFLSYQSGRDSREGAAGDREKYLQAAGAGFVRCTEDAEKLHAAYTAFARSQLEAVKGAKK